MTKLQPGTTLYLILKSERNLGLTKILNTNPTVAYKEWWCMKNLGNFVKRAIHWQSVKRLLGRSLGVFSPKCKLGDLGHEGTQNITIME